MAGNCAIYRSWETGNTLTAADLTTSFTQVGVTNFTPSCLDDYAIDTNQFRSTVDPYPASVASLPTSTAGELERIRYILKKITGWSQWYAHTETLVLPDIVGAAKGGTGLNTSASTGVATVNAGTWSIGSGAIITSSVGPHAIGGATFAGAQLYLTGAFGGGSGTRAGFWVDSTLTGAAGQALYGILVNTTLVEAGSGVHSLIAGLAIAIPDVSAGVATTTDAASLYVQGIAAATGTTNASAVKINSAGSGGSNNYALWVADGYVRIDSGTIFFTSSGGTGTRISAGATHFDFIGGTSDCRWYNNAGNAQRMILSDDGGLQIGAPTGGSQGVGTINVGTNLYKNGTAYTNPDYVLEHWATGQIVKFADRDGALYYSGLKPLADVEAFTRQTYMLPMIADFRSRAAEPGRGGLFDGGDALLGTVEQAYLYLFEHERRIDAIERRVRVLEAAIA